MRTVQGESGRSGAGSGAFRRFRSGDGRAPQKSLPGFLKDLRYSARSLGRSRGLAAA